MKRIALVMALGMTWIVGLDHAGATRSVAKVQKRRKPAGKKQFTVRQQQLKVQKWRRKGGARAAAARTAGRLAGERGRVRIAQGENGRLFISVRDPSGWRDISWSDFIMTADRATARDHMALYRQLDPKLADENMRFLVSRLPDARALAERFGIEP